MEKRKLRNRILLYTSVSVIAITGGLYFKHNYIDDVTNRKALYSSIKNADRILFLSSLLYGHEELLEITDPDGVHNFNQNIHIEPSPMSSACLCLGYPEMIWYKGDKIVAKARYHTHDLRWSELAKGMRDYGSGRLTDSADNFLLDFFREYGILWNNVGSGKTYYPEVIRLPDGDIFPETINRLTNTTLDKCFYFGKNTKFADCRNKRTVVLLENDPHAEFILVFIYYSTIEYSELCEKRIKSDVLWGFFERGNFSLPPGYEENLSSDEKEELQKYFAVLKQKYEKHQENINKTIQKIPVNYL